ncbi:hypothetical protein BDZ89DRAFT_1141621 [Hymenopellis radicata]|nr:hypothetical protein BDZ89DRAFT_1141621 [Hymenopellis radicata]
MSAENAPSADAATATNNLYGCTCGQCIAGWLSPRMIDQVRTEVAVITTLMLKKHRTFERLPNQTVPPHDAITLLNAEYIPPPLYADGLQRSFYQGYTATFQAAFDLLNANPTPMFTTATIRAHAQTAYAQETADYFNNGGQVAFVLDCITREAEGNHSRDEDSVLPKCRNDSEFAFVRRMLGLDSDKRWGRYGLDFVVDEEREEFGNDRFFEQREDDGSLDLFYHLQQRLAQRG